MGETRTEAEVRTAKIAAMGAPLGELHHALWGEVTWVHLKWNDYRALYATSKETFDLLFEAAPHFFDDLHRILWESVLLHLCRLTDPPQSCGYDNLTIQRLPALIADQALQAQCQAAVQLAVQKTAFARDRRNRHLAHRELPPIVGGAGRQPLAPASRRHVEEALAAIRDAMNCIAQHYEGGPCSYEHAMPGLGGTEALIYWLQEGLKAEKERRRQQGY